MRFRNTKEVALDFTLGGDRYQVPVGGTCEIPDRIAYAVVKHGLPLLPDPESATADERVGVGLTRVVPLTRHEPEIKPYTEQELRALEDAAFSVPKNASRKALLDLCDRFRLPHPPDDLPNKQVSMSLAVKLDEIRRSLQEAPESEED